MGKSKLLLLIVSIFLLFAWPSRLWALQSRLSMAVAEVSTGPEVLFFLQKPGAGYVQTFVPFGPDMPDDVIMTLDQEFIDGVRSPFYASGGDWMALLGVQRSSLLWIAAGTDATMHGTPSTARNWQIISLADCVETRADEILLPPV
jgi:hypothetical protein